MTTLQRWHRVEAIYHSALTLPRAQRKTFLAGACATDIMLQEEINSLLEADDSAGDFLETSAFELGLEILMDDSSKSLETVTGPAAADILIGTTVDGRYWVERELGHGGVGAVYLARDHKLHDKPVVVKVLLEQSLRNEWVVQKFKQEKEALARVEHPGVVGILDTGELPDGQPFIVMQYIEGMALRDAVRAKPDGMDLDRVALIIKQTGAALSAVHEKKIYHRDLKPENIMLQAIGRGEEQVKIVDFGIAKIKGSVIAPSTVTGAATAGTIVYMSPEQLRGQKVSATSDVYALGVIAYEMVTGRRPFNPDTIAHLAELQREGIRAKPADLRPRLSQQAERIILKALAFDPSARYQNAGEFGDALAHALMLDEETLQPQTAVPPTQLSVEPEPSAVPSMGQSVATLQTPYEPARPIIHDQSSRATATQNVRAKMFPKVVVSLVLALALLVGGYLIARRESLFGSGPKTAPGNPLDQRSLAYSLTVQKMRDGQPYKEPFESSGQEIFENGYKFRLNVSSPQAGYLYVFNEGEDEKTGKSFTIIYPTPVTNNGSAKLDAEQTMRTSWNTFLGRAGTEQFWIVWSAVPVAEMESAKDAAFQGKEGELKDAALLRSVREFLTKHSDPKPETSKDSTKKQTNVRGSGELLVKLVELEHS